MSLRDPKYVLKLLLACDAVLVILYLLTNLVDLPSWTVKHWLDLDAETNIPTWFSSIQLFLIFALATILAFLHSKRSDGKFLSRAFVLLGLIFLFFSMDETAMIHEGLGEIIKKSVGSSPLPGGHGIWILVYPVVLIITSVLFYKSILAFLRDTPGRYLFILGGFIFVAGGVVLEATGYYIVEHNLIDPSKYFIQRAMEEGTELLGQTLMIYALMIKLDTTVDRK